MLMPKRVKYRRVHRGRMTGKATRGNTLAYGEFGLVATEPAWITSNQIEAARIAMTRHTKRCVLPATSCPSRRRSSPALRKQVSKMKANEIREIRKMTPEQLNEKLAGLKKDLFFLRMQHATNQLDNPVKIRETKHDIARVKTVLAELAAAESKQ